jgi:hypothetical protein
MSCLDIPPLPIPFPAGLPVCCTPVPDPPSDLQYRIEVSIDYGTGNPGPAPWSGRTGAADWVEPGISSFFDGPYSDYVDFEWGAGWDTNTAKATFNFGAAFADHVPFVSQNATLTFCIATSIDADILYANVEHEVVVTFIQRTGGVDTILGVLPLEGTFGGLYTLGGPGVPGDSRPSPGEHSFGQSCGGDGVWATIRLVAGVPMLSVSAAPRPVLRCDSALNVVYEKCVPFSPATIDGTMTLVTTGGRGGPRLLRTGVFAAGPPGCGLSTGLIEPGCGITYLEWEGPDWQAMMFVNNLTLECSYELTGPRFNNLGNYNGFWTRLAGSGVVTVDADGYIRGTFTATAHPYYGCPDGEGSGGLYSALRNGARSVTFTL